jgi:hypothetical protein
MALWRDPLDELIEELKRPIPPTPRAPVARFVGGRFTGADECDLIDGDVVGVIQFRGRAGFLLEGLMS